MTKEEKKKEEEQKGLLRSSGEGSLKNEHHETKGSDEPIAGNKLQNKPKKKPLPSKKKFNQDPVINEEADQEASAPMQSSTRKRKMLPKKSKPQMRSTLNKFSKQKGKDDDLVEEVKEEEREEELPDYLSDKQKQQLLKQRKLTDKIKASKDKDHLFFTLMKIEVEEIEGMTRKEFRKKIMKERKKFTGDQLSDL